MKYVIRLLIADWSEVHCGSLAATVKTLHAVLSMTLLQTNITIQQTASVTFVYDYF